MSVTKGIGVHTARTLGQDRRDPTLQGLPIVHDAALGGGFETMRIAECADREAGREPGEHPIKPAPG